MTYYDKAVTVEELRDFFDMIQITGDQQALQRKIVIPDVNRPGFELTGFYKRSSLKRVVILGDKEIAYIKTLTEQQQQERFNHLTNKITPVIIISKNHPTPVILKKIAQEKNFPILSSSSPTFRIMVDVISFLDGKLAPSDNVHAVLMSVFGKGVLITGESGMGKSEIALELIRRGHVLVADDRVDVSRIHNTIVGVPPYLLKGFLEIRGIGIIDIVQMFGASAILDKCNVDFVVELEKWNPNREYARLGVEEAQYYNILGIDVPKLVFPVKEGRNMAVLIEAAVTNFSLKQMGIDSSRNFEARVYENIQQKNKEREEE